MSEIKIFLEVADGRLNVWHSIAKHESEELSKFQAIGLLYHMLDFITQLNPGLEYSALGAAREIFGGEGWSDEVIKLLLAAKSWENRMNAAWHIVDDEARKSALSLDYLSFQNYWPSLDFCQPEWRAKANSGSVSLIFKSIQAATTASLH
ncbi:hypothetical protein [Pseudomonas putida]|uniref:hypothetical protein n=1 Tax=Pseudomonas putida TaxID=303 RepID=UPI00059B1053|nr:hypothetical protein [Pseudomonas putida]